MKLQWVLAGLLLLAVPQRSGAQGPDALAQTELIQQLLARVQQLESRVAELEGPAQAARQVSIEKAIYTVSAGSAAVPAADASPAAQTSQDPMGMGMGPDSQGSYPSLKMSGFADFNFSATDQKGVRSGFNEGQFVLHFSSALSSKVNFFGELSATARTDAGTGPAGTPPATGFNMEVERSFIRFDQSDQFKVSFGRFHTPINWWNTAYHHGQWLQTSISRPEMTQFGGRFIPVHFVGAMAEGTVPAGGMNLSYNVGLGNGRGSVISRGGDAGDSNNNRAWLVNLYAKPDSLFGLQVGGSAYRDKVTLSSGREFREWISSAHIVWAKETPEIIGEFANVNHQEVGGQTSFNSQAYYIQLGYRLPWFEKLWKPYYRFEYIHIPRSDAVLTGVPNLAGSTIGLRYDISSFAALKAEYRNQRRAPGQPNINGGFLQTSFTF